MDIIATVIIPYVRPQFIDDLVSMVHSHAGIGRSRYEVIAEEDTERIGCPKMVARMVERAAGQRVVFIGDDTLPQPGFLKRGMDVMERFPDGWGLVGFNDLTGRDLPTHWIADRRMLPLIDGEFFHTGYTHCFCDNELHERALALGRYRFAIDAVVLHRHPMIEGSGGVMDDDYLRVYRQNVFQRDQLLFYERRHLWQR